MRWVVAARNPAHSADIVVLSRSDRIRNLLHLRGRFTHITAGKGEIGVEFSCCSPDRIGQTADIVGTRAFRSETVFFSLSVAWEATPLAASTTPAPLSWCRLRPSQLGRLVFQIPASRNRLFAKTLEAFRRTPATRVRLDDLVNHDVLHCPRHDLRYRDRMLWLRRVRRRAGCAD